MTKSSSFFNVSNPTPDNQPALYAALVSATNAVTAATASLNAVLAEYATYTDTWSSSVTINWSLAMTHRLTLTGSPTTFTFTGGRDGQKLILELKQDSVGSRLITLPSNVRYSSSIGTVVLSTAANKIDKLGFIYNSSDNKYDIVAIAYGAS